MSHSNLLYRPDLFRTYVTDSKLLSLYKAIDQCEQTHVQLRQNEEQRQQLKQQMEYNYRRIMELDLARQRILHLNYTIEPNVDRTSRSVDVVVENSIDVSKMPETPRTNNTIALIRPPTPRKPTQFTDLKWSSISSFPLMERKEVDMMNNQALLKADHPQAWASGSNPLSFTVNNDKQQQTDSDQISTDEISRKRKKKKKKQEKQKSRSKPRSQESKYFNDQDVLFGRGNFTYNHPGNKKYREYVKSMKSEYFSKRKCDKMAVADKVLDHIQNICGGRFLSNDKDKEGSWVVLSNVEARKKIGQSLREKFKQYAWRSTQKKVKKGQTDTTF